MKTVLFIFLIAGLSLAPLSSGQDCCCTPQRTVQGYSAACCGGACAGQAGCVTDICRVPDTSMPGEAVVSGVAAELSVRFTAWVNPLSTAEFEDGITLSRRTLCRHIQPDWHASAAGCGALRTADLLAILV